MPADLTIADLRVLIDTAARKSGRTVEKVLILLPRWALLTGEYDALVTAAVMDPDYDSVLFLEDPATAWMLVPLLALCHGLDPGPGGRWVAWRPLYASGPVGLRRVGWWLSGDNEAVYYVTAADTTAEDDEIVSDAIAAEPDDLAALVAACKLVINTNP